VQRQQDCYCHHLQLLYKQASYSEQSLDYIFGLGYFIFLPFCGDWSILASVIWSILGYSMETVLSVEASKQLLVHPQLPYIQVSYRENALCYILVT
jgi:hypothetical protein